MSIRLQSPISSLLQIEASIAGGNVQSVGGTLYPRLGVPVRLGVKGILNNHNDSTYSVQLGDIQGELIVDGQKVSDSIPNHLNRLVYEFDQDEHLTLEFPVDAGRIEWIEQQRQGCMQGSVRVKISCLTLGEQRGDPIKEMPRVAFRDSVTISGEIPFTVPDTQWREKVCRAWDMAR